MGKFKINLNLSAFCVAFAMRCERKRRRLLRFQSGARLKKKPVLLFCAPLRFSLFFSDATKRRDVCVAFVAFVAFRSRIPRGARALTRFSA